MLLLSNGGLHARIPGMCNINEAATMVYHKSPNCGDVDISAEHVFTGTVLLIGVVGARDGQWWRGTPCTLAKANMRWLRKMLDLTGSLMWNRLTHTRIPRPSVNMLLGTFLLAMERMETDGTVVMHYSVIEDLLACGTWSDYQA